MKLEPEEIEAIAEAVARRLAPRHATGMSPRLLSVDQAAAYLGRSKEGVQHLIASGKVPTVRTDRRVFLDVRDLDRWIEDHKT